MRNILILIQRNSCYVRNINNTFKMPVDYFVILWYYDGIKTIKYDYTYDNSGNRTSLKKSGIDHPETIAPTTNTLTDDYATDYYLYDGRGSVSQVVSADQIVAQYTYDPFGNVTSGAPAFDSFYGYNAEDTNPVTGLQYLRARYYNTDSGRFNVAG